MKIKVLCLIFNVITIFTLMIFKMSLIETMIILMLVNVSYYIMYSYLTSKQLKEFELLAKNIDLIEKNKFNYDDVKYNEYMIEKVNHSIVKLNQIFQAKNHELILSRKHIQDTTSDIAHQLRNSLHAMMLYLGKEPELLKSEIYKLNDFVEELIKVVNIEVVSQTIQLEKCLLNDLILQAIRASYVYAKEQNVVINYENETDIFVEANYKWSLEVIINLINNGIKYSDGGYININVRSNHTYVVLTVEDNNQLIAESNINKIFEKFYRGTNSKNTEGMGVGLYLVKNIMVKQKGFVKYFVRDEKNVFELYFLKSNE